MQMSYHRKNILELLTAEVLLQMGSSKELHWVPVSMTG